MSVCLPLVASGIPGLYRTLLSGVGVAHAQEIGFLCNYFKQEKVWMPGCLCMMLRVRR